MCERKKESTKASEKLSVRLTTNGQVTLHNSRRASGGYEEFSGRGSVMGDWPIRVCSPPRQAA
jgi:hypothetical protein